MNLLITLTTRKGSPLAYHDADALPTLSNAGATAGIIRNDTSAIVVAAGTAFTKIATGQYVYNFADAIAGVSYTAYRRVTLDGVTQVLAKVFKAATGVVTPTPDPAAPTTIGDALVQNALDGIASSSGDGQSTTMHSLPDQIAADKYAATKAASKRRGLPIRHVKLIPPGAADVC